MRYSPREVILTEQELRNLCRWWQEVLGLSDWYIKVNIKRAYDMPRDFQGECSWTFARREAVIKILDSSDYDPDFAFPQDMELTLVHELLHVRYGPAAEPEDTATKWLYEQATEDIARALVALKRASKEGRA